jgi:hypothetical protein
MFPYAVVKSFGGKIGVGCLLGCCVVAVVGCVFGCVKFRFVGFFV